MQLLKNHT